MWIDPDKTDGGDGVEQKGESKEVEQTVDGYFSFFQKLPKKSKRYDVNLIKPQKTSDI